MPVERPTFSESWYRVATLRPRLRSTVQVYRQHYRGQMWHVLQDPSNNQFSRLSEPAYQFVALLDGQRTISQVWDACNAEFGDSAPTQGEAVQLLGQLYTANLLQGELPPDAAGLFERHRKRVQREIQGYLANLLFLRIPVLDPDRFLQRWVSIVGKIFTLPGLIAWAMLVAFGLAHVVRHWSELYSQADHVLDPDNLVFMYISLILIKVVHEFGHAFACKKFGLEAGGGEVHVVGVMFLVFTPLPYVDASSSWAFRQKWRRLMVDAGGMYVELAMASVAAMIWANTSPGALHTIMFNMMFIASVSTVLFNANPLLRYDGYYMLSDLLEIPNLANRAKQYIYYLVRKYAWGVKHLRNPAHTGGEKGWFVFYGVASTFYRFFICFRILLFIADKLFMVGAVLAVASVFVWVMIPVGKFLHYLFTSGELMRTRGRAMLSTVAALVVVVALVGLLPVGDRVRVDGEVWPDRMQTIYAKTPGWVHADFAPDGTVVKDGAVLVNTDNFEVETNLTKKLAEREGLKVEQMRGLATGDNKLVSQAMVALDRVEAEIAKLQEDYNDLTIRAPLAGVWVAPDVEVLQGTYVKNGDRLGVVADLDKDLIIRSFAQQDYGPLLLPHAQGLLDQTLAVEIRVKGRPDPELTGKATVKDIRVAGANQLPSAAMSAQAGGGIATDIQDPNHLTPSAPVFEVRVHLALDKPAGGECVLWPGQRVVVRFHLSKKPLGQQWWRALSQLIQRRGL
jgi:putative peptide zinc metalloprotease protein